MKRIFLISLLSVGWSLSALGALYDYSGTFSGGASQNGGAIPNGNLNGWSETVNVSGMVPTIASVTVTVNLSASASAYNGDLYAYITDGNGTAILLNRIGVGSSDPFGNSGSGMNVTFSTGGTDIHLAPYGYVTGTYGPDGRAISPLSSPSAFDAPGTEGLTGFNGTDPNANWTLFIADPVSGGDNFSVVSWGLTIDAVPEPTNIALGIFGVCAVAGRLRAGWKKSRASAKTIDYPKTL